MGCNNGVLLVYALTLACLVSEPLQIHVSLCGVMQCSPVERK